MDKYLIRIRFATNEDEYLTRQKFEANDVEYIDLGGGWYEAFVDECTYDEFRKRLPYCKLLAIYK